MARRRIRLFVGSGLLALAFLTGCGGVDYPAGAEDYVGYWSSTGANVGDYEISIELDREVQQRQTVDGFESSISGAITEWRGDNFVVFFREFVVEEVPHEVEVDVGAGGTIVKTRMTIDGFELTKWE